MLRKRKVSDHEVGDLLSEKTFSSSKPLNQAQEEGGLIEVTLDQIAKSSLNPRMTKNPKYEEIKDSIRNRGLDQPPRITKRNPNQEKWEIADGGNSRVDILWELYTEFKTKAEQCQEIPQKVTYDQQALKYYKFEAKAVPWKGEINALSGHIVENELHAPMLFIEKALAAKKLKELFEGELRDPENLSKYKPFGIKKSLSANENLGTRPLARLITSQGWPMNPGNLTRFQYAADVLVHLIPEALWAGAGHEVVAKIKKLGTSYLTVIKQLVDNEQTAKELFNTLWEEALRANDSEQFQSRWNLVRKEMESLLAKHISLDVTKIAAEVNKLLTYKDKETSLIDLQLTANESSQISESGAMKISQSSNLGTDDDKAMDSTKNIDLSLKRKQLNKQLLDKVTQLVSEYSILHLLKKRAGESSVAIRLAAPNKPFGHDENERFLWLRLFSILSVSPKDYERNINKAFGTNITATEALYQMQQYFLNAVEAKSILKLLRKIEDIVLELRLMLATQGEGK